MKKDFHPEYKETKIICACGNVLETRATKEELHTEICSACHPFFTGKQKFVDTAGRVEKFQTRYGNEWKKTSKKTKAKKAAAKPAETEVVEAKIEIKGSEAEPVEAETIEAEAPDTEAPETEATETEATQTSN